MAEKLPGGGFFGWLGRQFGHVRTAVRTDVEKKVLFRRNTVQEAPLPNNPNVKLRRTTIDEVIVHPPRIRPSNSSSTSN